MFSTSRLRDKLAPSEKYKAKMILEGYNRIGCDAINVGAYDLSAGLPFLKSLIDSTTIPFISANLVEVSSGELSFEPYLLIEHEPFTIGVIGVSNLLPTTVKELRQEDYLEAGKSYIDKLKEKADIIVMLVNANRSDKNEIIEAFQDADYIFLSRDMSKMRPKDMRETRPFLYTSNKQGKYLSVVDLTIADADSPLVDVSKYESEIQTIDRRLASYQRRDKSKLLEELYANQQSILKKVETLKKNKTSANNAISTAFNRNIYRSVPMNKKMGDDPQMLSFVDSVFKEIERLGGDTGSKKKSKKPKVSSNKLRKK